MMPVLVCLTGLPGVGKSTIAKRVAQKTGALWLWLDEIETAMRDSHMQTDDLADGGYAAAQAVATGALRQGYDVIADCVNPIDLTRAAWRRVSEAAGVQHLDVELTCADLVKHRHRVETRNVELPGWKGPDWASVEARGFVPLTGPGLRIDTGQTVLSDAVSRVVAALWDAKNKEGTHG